MKEIICSGALFYAKKSKRFLFLHRTQGKQKDLWGLVGGTNEDKEAQAKRLKQFMYLDGSTKSAAASGKH